MNSVDKLVDTEMNIDINECIYTQPLLKYSHYKDRYLSQVYLLT